MKIIVAVIIGLLVSFISGFSTRNLDYLKENAVSKWRAQGFTVIDYEGYEWGFGYGKYGGAKVWHRLRRYPDNGFTYSGYLVRWGDEIHVYGPKTMEGIKP